MTAARQPGKSHQTRHCVVIAAGLALFVGGMAGIPHADAGEPAAVVVNDHSGLAISGFDPVAYFAEKTPAVGRPELELSRGGVIWRFRNEGNRAEFSEHPDVYMPQFGGYDPVAIARGTSVPGNPLNWAVVGERLYLFYSAKARADFLTDPGRIINSATRKWPQVSRTVAR